MPNNKHFIRYTIFEDKYYIEDESGEKEFSNLEIIGKIKKLIENNLEKIEVFDIVYKSKHYPRPKNSFQKSLLIKYANSKFNIDLYAIGKWDWLEKFMTSIGEILFQNTSTPIINTSNNND